MKDNDGVPRTRKGLETAAIYGALNETLLKTTLQNGVRGGDTQTKAFLLRRRKV